MKKSSDNPKAIRWLLIAVEILAAVAILAIILPTVLRERVREDVTASEAEAALHEAAAPGEDETMKAPGNALELPKTYGIDPSSLEGFYFRLPASNMDVMEEVFLIAPSEKEAKECLTALEERLAARKKDFESYGVEQMKYLNGAVVRQKGRYAFLIISLNAEEKQEALLKLLR